MLTNGTKRRIDTARDILVGKLPDPKSQVEQITIALIYKFMDDMDKQSEELGGKVKFFTGEYAKYAWSKIFDPHVSGYELVGLYGKAIQRMNHNPNIPQLFREIFKNAYLPYRDPETLKSFLKTIGEFEYDHSEKLGDAFEYLLSIMGSQGDAGQFRTPRHIIDFIVKVVDPGKNETILDPACGTAGFLISSYKHILEKNKKDSRVYLTPAQKKRLIENFSGYDISPDMVRLSLVNMYLHGFTNPKIYEYDTLTSEEKWQEVFDVILANPPFMSPKGGIRPHKRFSVQANRSEVLFVDYIAEHLNPNGRAGIIVPEGIIFQSGTAYKKLRKMLVDHSLYAVVSLPAGVFNPYSGVKTSILMLDKNLAKKTNRVLFVKINNDGFGLGAQRREVKGSDLPLALEIITRYKQSIIENKEFEFNADKVKLTSLVEKTKIAESGDYNLSGDRYKETIIYSGKWDFVELGEILTLEYGKPLKKENRGKGLYPVFGSNGIVGYHNSYLVEGPFIIIGRKGSAGAVTYSEISGYPIDTTFFVKIKDTQSCNLKYLYFQMLNLGLDKVNIQSGVPGLNRNDAYKIKIPLPSLEVQKQIVAELDNYQKIIDGAKQVVENYKPTFKINPDWEMVEFEKICSVQSGGTPSKDKNEYWEHGDIPWLGSTVCKDCFVNGAKQFITQRGLSNSSAKIFKQKTTLIALVGATIGKTAFLTFESTTNQNIAGIYPKDERILLPEFVFYATQTLYGEFMKLSSGKFRMANLSFIKSLKIPFPPIGIQQQIVAQIEKEQKAVEATRDLITLFEQKIKDKISDVWGE